MWNFWNSSPIVHTLYTYIHPKNNIKMRDAAACHVRIFINWQLEKSWRSFFGVVLVRRALICRRNVVNILSLCWLLCQLFLFCWFHSLLINFIVNYWLHLRFHFTICHWPDQVITKNDLQQKFLIVVTLLIFVIDNLEQNLLRQPMSFVVLKRLLALDMFKFWKIF